nr:MFS transporter [uncultured Psychroserpens sp.]
MQQSHSLSAFSYAISNGIERASYYGIRSILIIYMVGESLQVPENDALEFYGMLTMSFYISKVFGALLGDLLIGNKTAILIGGLLQTLGCFLLCVENVSMLYVSIALIVIGSGLFAPNVFGQFGKQYINKTKIIDAGLSGYFLFINLGGMLGIIIIGYLGDKNFNYGFIFGGILMLTATLIAYFSKNRTIDETQIIKEKSNEILKKIVFVFVAIILAGVFWACYEIYFGSVLSLSIIGAIDVGNFYEMTSFGAIIILGILTVIWTFVYTNQFSKFCIGLLISALAVSLLITLPETSNDGNTNIIFISGLLLALGEAFLSPMLYAITTRYSNPKYLAILLSLVGLPILMFNKIAGKISEFTYDFKPTGIFIALTSVLILFGIIACIMWFFQKRDDHKLLLKVK